MATLLLNARTVRQLPTSAQKISKHFACYFDSMNKNGMKQPTGTKKLVSKMLTKCLLIEQGEYNEHEKHIILRPQHQVNEGRMTVEYGSQITSPSALQERWP